jgi:hypothetical protein
LRRRSVPGAPGSITSTPIHVRRRCLDDKL